MGETTQSRGVGFSEACEMSGLRKESASDYYETVRPKEILSNEVMKRAQPKEAQGEIEVEKKLAKKLPEEKSS